MVPIVLAMVLAAAPQGQLSSNTAQPVKLMRFYDFKMKDIDGKTVPMSDFKGKVVMVVNVASKCGNTPQYEALEALYESKKDQGLVILGFPANEFGGQEPGTDASIKEFCTSTYNVTFPMFSKIVVNGAKIDPLYRWLVSEGDRHEDIEWNFAKFLLDREGRVIGRFDPKTKPDSEEVIGAVNAALAQPASE